MTKNTYFILFNLWIAIAVLMLFIGIEGKAFSLICVLLLAGISFYRIIKEKPNRE